jgi:hypothetical protein
MTARGAEGEEHMSSKLSERLRVIQLKAHAALAVNTTGTGVAVGAAGPHRAMAIVDMSAVGGDADETYTITIEGSNTAIDSGFELAHASGEAATLPFTQPNGAQVAKVGLNPYRWYRYVLVVAGTTITCTFGVHVVLEPSKLPAAAQVAT